jgi:hypothetical protein
MWECIPHFLTAARGTWHQARVQRLFQTRSLLTDGKPRQRTFLNQGRCLQSLFKRRAFQALPLLDQKIKINS